MALTYTGAAVIGYNETIRTVASTSLRRRVAEVLAAQGGAALQACEQKNPINMMVKVLHRIIIIYAALSAKASLSVS